MLSRRDFLRRAGQFSGGIGAMSVLPRSILKAAGIEPVAGSTFLDADHVVILMQENRSFDHAFGALRGVRGFDDPRAITIPGGRPVWLQTDTKGDAYAPFPLKIHESSSTWMSCLPHDRRSEVAAGNGGKHDQWLPVMRSGIDEYEGMPLTLGYYDRQDIPFYYAFADAFTVCDQHFCSLQTCTTPNRLYLWTGTSRDPLDPASEALLGNGQADHDTHPSWNTFPERLEERGIAWKIYQNEIDFPTGLAPEEAAWLGNFGDNPMEYFAQYHVEFSPARIADLKSRLATLEQELVPPTDGPLSPEEEVTRREGVERKINAISSELERCSPENFARLPERDKNLHRKAFTTNTGDPAYRDLAAMAYPEGDEQRVVHVPAGDVFHQFRTDVAGGGLPVISWLVAPENFSDHPSAPWYGAWYVSEVLDILTKDPEVWKKTIFILTYDENDGYYDHVPPFVPPHPDLPGSGAASPEIDTRLEFDAHGNPLGLGYRVPMVIASPWSRGGNVCSEVFDHTSVLQFLEVFLSHKTGAPIRETNIGPWRRAICGDLTSAFLPNGGTPDVKLPPLQRDPFVESIHRAQYLGTPGNFKALDKAEIQDAIDHPLSSPVLPRQEPGSRASCALPYELLAEGKLNHAKGVFEVVFEAAESRPGSKAGGAPFQVYAPGATYPDDAASYTDAPAPLEEVRRWSFAVTNGSKLRYAWPLDLFEGKAYHLRSYGPNGFFREYRGDASDPDVEIISGYSDGRLLLRFVNRSRVALTVSIADRAYGTNGITRLFAAGADEAIPFDLSSSHRWYDLEVAVAEAPRFSRRYAGRVETGTPGMTDPLIGREGVATARRESSDSSLRKE